jgi:hypothetical protein
MRFKMNSILVGGVIRAIVPPVIAYLVGKGTLPAGDYGSVVTGIVALATAFWSVQSKLPNIVKK